MGFEEIIAAIGGLIIIIFFSVVFLPALGEVTGQNMTLYIILLIVLGIAIIIGLVGSRR